MNIFVPSNIPSECAQMLDDQRLNKMQSESCQMLSTAVRMSYDDKQLVKAFVSGRWKYDWYYITPMDRVEGDVLTVKWAMLDCYHNHPCTVWTRQTRSNFQWHLTLLMCMNEEWRYRFNKVHDTAKHVPEFNSHAKHIRRGELTPFVNCTPYELDTHEAYKQTMLDKWAKSTPVWTKRGAPQLWVQNTL